jgi:hypothetical protein
MALSLLLHGGVATRKTRALLLALHHVRRRLALFLPTPPLPRPPTPPCSSPCPAGCALLRSVLVRIFFPVVWSLHRHCFTDQIESKVIIFLVFSSQVLMFVYVKQFTDEKQRILYATLWHLTNLSYPSNCHFSLYPCHLTVSSHIRFVSPLVLVWTNNLCIQILNGPFV